MATVDRGNSLFDLAAAVSAAAETLPGTVAGAVIRDCVAATGGWYLTPLSCGQLTFRLSIINRLLHNRLSITENI